jgi:hypothetical protein
VARVRGTLGVLIPAALVTGALTVLFLSMRSVMDVGGSCGSGGTGLPPCPGNSAGLLFAGIWGGLIFAGIYVWQAAAHHVPSFVSLLWPGLFISLGYNFFDYAFKGGGVQAGFVVCGVVFVLMGGVPLIWALPHLWKVYVLGEIEAEKPLHVAATGTAVNTLKALSRIQSSRAKADMTENLERLASLHKSGALDDLEYAKAKDRVIRGQSTA